MQTFRARLIYPIRLQSSDFAIELRPLSSSDQGKQMTMMAVMKIVAKRMNSMGVAGSWRRRLASIGVVKCLLDEARQSTKKRCDRQAPLGKA